MQAKKNFCCHVVPESCYCNSVNLLISLLINPKLIYGQFISVYFVFYGLSSFFFSK